MWNLLLDRIPTMRTLICAVLSAVIPWTIYSINQALHRYGEPSWKKNAK